MNMKENKKQGETFSISKQNVAQLMSVFSHDLRNPLINMNALLSDMQMSLSDAGNDSTAICDVVQGDLPESLEMMTDVITHMNGLVSGVNDIYHCMFDDLEPEYIQLSELVERVLARQQEVLQDKDISVTARELSVIWADPLAMERIVTALLENALHFTPTGGHISLHTEKRSGVDVLVVRDSGVGMSEGDFKRVFQPFFSTDKKRAGMGLAVVKSLLQAHGGQIWCESTLGAGSIFYIALPNQDLDT
ncbi:MAG: HAMP domain-containing sensor histidine kinase [Mariprofundaceae bacterium]|nr:HAMP domain-containing sensor histidine kinase [Mariprofundaceae bacterium]